MGRRAEIFFAHSRPYKNNDQATVESENNHLVRKYGFYYRYDTKNERVVLNRLWKLVNDRLNYLTPTKKPVRYGSDRNGCRTRLYHRPKTRWTACWQPRSLRRHVPSNCSPSATRSTPPRSAVISLTSSPYCSSSPKTRPNSSTLPRSPASWPMFQGASSSTSLRPPDRGSVSRAS